jgi:triacylglycerol lipase
MISLVHRMIFASSVLFGLFVSTLLAHRLALAWFWTLPLALFMPVLLHGLVIGIGFHLAGWFDKANDNHPGLSPWQRYMAAAKVWRSEVPSSARLFSWLQPWFSKKPLPQPCATVQRGQHPILFVHGYFCNQAMWHPLAEHWRTTQFGSGRLMAAVTMEPAFGSIDDYPRVIAKAAEALKAAGGKAPIIIGHSMGGLAARAYVRDFGIDSVRGVISLGTPHQGTALAQLGHGINVSQMRQHSPWLSALAEHEAHAGLPDFHVILSVHDNIVSPRAEQVLPGVPTTRVEGMGHMALALRPEIWSLMEKIIQQWDQSLA